LELPNNEKWVGSIDNLNNETQKHSKATITIGMKHFTKGNTSTIAIGVVHIKPVAFRFDDLEFSRPLRSSRSWCRQ